MNRKLKVWLVREGEALPSDEGQQRLLRMGLIGEELNKRGAEVLWWASTFDHNQKKYRAANTVELHINDHYSIVLLHGREYKKNISVRRLLHYADERKQFAKLAQQREKPDIILAAMPNIDLAIEAVRYGKKNNIPVFVDVRDMWPDLYEEYFPVLKRAVCLAITPFKRQLSYTLRNATGIYATSDKFLGWALNYAGRNKGPKDNYYYVSYPDTDVELTEEDMQFWKQMGLSPEDTICCFFGQFGHAVNLETVMYAALETAKQNPHIKYVICGVGEKLDSYRKILNGAENVIFSGWVNRKQICALGRIASVGLLSYHKNKNFEWSMPNKFCEYLALGLCLMIEPPGMMADLAGEYQCGFRYEDSHDMAERLIYLDGHREEVAEMKVRARELYEKEFKADVVYGRMAEDLAGEASDQKSRL